MSGGYGQGGWPPPGGPPPGGSPGWPQQNIYAPPGSPGWTPQQQWPGGQGPQQPQSAGTQAIVALVLAIAAWFLCGCLTGLPAIFVARAELAAIERGESPAAGKSMAQAAFWVALVNTIVYGIAIVIYALVAFVFVAANAHRF